MRNVKRDTTEGLESELPRPVLGPYTAAQIEFAREAWPMRAAEELRSAWIFRALTRAAQRIAMADPWPERFARTTHDEIRHARLCVAVGARLGAPSPRYDMRPVRARLATLADPRVRAASLLLVEVAIGETISMCLFRAGRRAAIEPLSRAALASILRDEARHQRLGWEGLAALWPELGADRRDEIQREAARGLAACERHVAVPALRWLESGRPFDGAYAALGVIDPRERVETFYFAVERLIVPRLTRLGLDGAAAWRDRYVQSREDRHGAFRAVTLVAPTIRSTSDEKLSAMELRTNLGRAHAPT